MLNEAITPESRDFADYYALARLPLLDLLGDWRAAAALDIGCGSGATLRALQQRMPACRLWGIEPRAEAAAAARCLEGVDDILEADVLSLHTRDLPCEGFDLVVLSHVLEHFAEPEKVLAMASALLRPDGKILIALPNIRHISVLLPLLLHGEFRYQASGILDHTHLRFFTRKSAERWLGDQGFRIVRAVPEFGGGKSRLLRRLTLGWGSDLAAYAYNFLVVKA